MTCLPGNLLYGTGEPHVRQGERRQRQAMVFRAFPSDSQIAWTVTGKDTGIERASG